MHLNTIRTLAKAQGISTHKKDKPALIRAIQRKEGNFDCFGSAVHGYCDQGECLWRQECLPAKPNKIIVPLAAANTER